MCGRATRAWTVLGVGQSSASLVLAYLPVFGDRYVPATPSVEESDEAICITVLGEGPPSPAATPGVIEMSLDIALAPRRLTVELSRPILGRRIEGPNVTFRDGQAHNVATWVSYDDDGRPFWGVPRVVGLSPQDAKWVLTAQGVEHDVAGPLGRQTTAQDPPPDTIVSEYGDGGFHGKVTLSFGN